MKQFNYHSNFKLAVKSVMHLQEVIVENHHLPNVPTEKEVISKGIKPGDMNAKLLEKIEELTLYLIEKNQQLQDQQKINKNLEDHLDQLEKIMGG